ncbi:MAG: DNA polymerase I [Firmicutes bacterium]|nr:DNA polymerase I [Bacillota bacterium]
MGSAFCAEWKKLRKTICSRLIGVCYNKLMMQDGHVPGRDGWSLTSEVARSERPKLLLIDGNSVLFRAFYGVPLLTTASGLYTNAVYGLAMMMLNVLKVERPTHVAVAFDKGKETFRHAEFTEYKGKRSATPPELVGQFAMARELMTEFGIPYLEQERFEADDIIGTLARQGEERGYEVVVVSGDKDLLQLVSDDITTCLTRKGTTDLVRYDPAAVYERFTLSPKQIIDLKGLMGDASDNIPGVPGIGEKTAIKLLSQFSTVEEVLSHVDEVSGKKVQERLREFHDQALQSKWLATIHCEVPLAIGVDDLAYEGYDLEGLRKAFRKYEFRTLVDRLQIWQVQAAKADASIAEPTSLPSDDQTEDVEPAGSMDEMAAMDTVSLTQLAARLGEVKGSAAVLLDIAGDYQTGQLRGIVVAHASGVWYGQWSKDAEHVASYAQLADWLRDDSVRKVVYDYKALLVCLVSAGVLSDVLQTCQPVFDTLLASYLLFTSEGEPTLTDVIERALPEVSIPEGVRLAIEKQEQAARPQALAWCARQLLGAQPHMQQALDDQALTALYGEVELPLSEVLAQLELYGVRLDTERLKAIGDELTAGIARLTARIYEMAGMTFNINSTKQLGEILFEKMGLAPIKKTKTGYSTSADVLEKLAPQSALVSEILAYRQLTKLQSTYVEGLLRVVRMPDSRVHTSFHQAMTATGRLSSVEPNLQNIPIRLEEGRRLRQAFVPTDPDWIMLSADYSQVELRILAHLSQDPVLIDAFLHDMDIHTRTASDVFEVPVDEVTSLMRRQAKAVNFGIIYGISDYGLSQNLNIARAQAAKFIEQYFAKFPGVKGYMEESVQRARDLGYAETVLGRRRYLPGIRSRNFNERSFAERTAMNTPIQGSAADIIKKAMVQLDATLRSSNLQARMLLQVHDELIFECPAEEQEALTTMVRGAMEHAVELCVPLRVDVNAGPSWYEAK